MRSLMLVLAVSAFMSAQSAFSFAQAQTTQDFDNELEAFKKKVAAAKAGSASQIDAMTSKEEAPAAEDPALASPLGLAATLPVKGTLPATSRALSPMDMPIDGPMDSGVDAAQRELERQTFESALKQLLPLSTDQIRAVYDEFAKSRKAAETPIAIPESRTQVQTISLDPSQEPLVIRTSPGYVTTVSILDSSGAPWPVQDISFAGEFDVAPPESGGNVMRITPKTAHGMGNMSVRLVDLVTPVVFTLSTSLETVDYRFEARVAKPGPLAKTPIIELGGLNTVAGTDANLVAVLDGTIPAGAEKLRLKGTDGRTTAWRLGGRVYLRTPLSLLSPAWDSSVASSDGTTVYTLNDTPVILLSDDGIMVRAHIAAADEVMP